MTDIDRSSMPRGYVSFNGKYTGTQGPYEDELAEHADDVRRGACDMARWRREDERFVRCFVALALTLTGHGQ